MCGIVATLIYPQRRSSATWAAIAQCFTKKSVRKPSILNRRMNDT